MVVVVDTPVEASPVVPPSGSSATADSHKGGTTFDADFRKEATAQEELEQLCFVNLTPKCTSTDPVPLFSRGSIAEVSCSSSTCSANGNLSDSGSSYGTKANNANSHTAPELERGLSSQINAKLLKRTTSRHGRSSQRWAADPISHSAVRLTTGCVPIVKGGKVLFVSASSKPAWIFPKGGWESDEKMEESALRESFEEAGVIGVLGPKLSEVQYETRKARKRRLETEEMLKRKKEKLEGPATPRSEDSGLDLNMPSDTSGSVVIDTSALKDTPLPPIAATAAPMSDEAFARIRTEMRKKSKRQLDETSSIQSDQSSYSQVRMCLFPLYVTSVKSEWPENGRLRRAVPIDEAIDILETRPELQAALKEVREKRLHLLEREELPADSKQSAPNTNTPSNNVAEEVR